MAATQTSSKSGWFAIKWKQATKLILVSSHGRVTFFSDMLILHRYNFSFFCAYVCVFFMLQLTLATVEHLNTYLINSIAFFQYFVLRCVTLSVHLYALAISHHINGERALK